MNILQTIFDRHIHGHKLSAQRLEQDWSWRMAPADVVERTPGVSIFSLEYSPSG